jgi:hypothetical protein
MIAPASDPAFPLSTWRRGNFQRADQRLGGRRERAPAAEHDNSNRDV